MNCEAFELSLLAEPRADNEERDRHAAQCRDCAALRRKALRLESRLETLLAVPVPAAVSKTPLSDVVARAEAAGQAESNVVSLAPRRRWRAPLWLAAAASVALLAVFVARQPSIDSSNGERLAQTLIEHIDHELGEMRVVDTAVSGDRLGRVLSDGSSALNGSLPLVSYANSCVINGRAVPHLVMQGARGPVTVLLMPSESVDTPVAIRAEGLEGVILPVGAGGSIALIGRDAAAVDAVRDAALDAVEFSI